MKMNLNCVSSCENNRGHLNNCRSILQEIVWMVDNWDNALRKYHVTKREEEVINCENALIKVKEIIWTSCLTMFSKYDYQTKIRKDSQNALMYNQPQVTGDKMVNNNTEVLMSENYKNPVAVHQRETTHTVVVSNSPLQQIVKNLLLEWSVFINANFQLCLLGTLPNDGTWETSAISTRLGPTTVKTISGTVYNMHGKMVSHDEDIPDFVQEKFRDGFPEDWKDVAKKWISILKSQRVPAEKAEVEPCVIQNNIQTRPAITSSPVSQVKEPYLQTVPKFNTRKALGKENPSNPATKLTSRGSPLLRPTQNQEDESSDSEEEELDKRKATKEVNSLLARHSIRLLSKSLLDSTVTPKKQGPQSKIANEKFNYLRHWTVEFSKRKDTAYLCGTLTDEQGNYIQKYHMSEAITNRVQAAIVETKNGDLYRLVGPSSSRCKHFTFGLPVDWKKLKDKLPSKHYSWNAQRDFSPSASRRSRSLTRSKDKRFKVKRHSSMINHAVEHQLTKAQHASDEDRKHGFPKRTLVNSIAPKRRGRPRKVSETGQRKALNDSQEIISVGESTSKREVIKGMGNNDGAKIDERKTNAVEETEAKKPKKTPAEPEPPETTMMQITGDKYTLRLMTDDIHSDNELDIF